MLWLTALEKIYLVEDCFTKTFPLNTTLSVIPALSKGNSKGHL
ncbi:MAG: hypothetical protein ACOXZ2_03735 [Sphaerochaetaceae bacterium]